MPYKDQKEFTELVAGWWVKNNSIDIDSVRKDALGSFIVGNNSQEFIVTKKIVDFLSGYNVALAYNVNKGRLKCRIFYKSKSESDWRIFTGLREANAGYAWVKGAEKFINIDPDKHMPGGYIGEGLLQNYLASKINELPHEECHVKANIALAESAKNLSTLGDFIIQPTALIQNDYVAEREIKSDYLNTITGLVSKPFYKKAQTEILRTASDKKNAPEDKASEIKHDNALWTKINEGLNNHIASYNFRHDILGAICQVDIYRIKAQDQYKCYIEISREKTPRSISYLSKTGVNYTASTPICWVKNAYICSAEINYGSEGQSWGLVSSFGNYLSYADDLWFLVQKPMDYLMQSISDDTIMSAQDTGGDIVTNTSDQSPIVRRMGVKSNIFIKITRKSAQNVEDRRQVANAITTSDPYGNTYGNYIVHALYNEKYSPLIQEYKIKNNLELFKSTSSKFQASQAININKFISSIKDNSSNKEIILGLLQVLKNGISDYLSSNEKSRWKDTGKKRANDFRNLIDLLGAQPEDYGQPITYEQLGNIVFQLFSRNRVARSLLKLGEGKKNQSDITYGLHSIQTSESSLFTHIARNLLREDNFVTLLGVQGGLINIKLDNSVIYKQNCRSDDCLVRFYIKSLELKATPDNVTTHSAQLLMAINNK